MNAKIYVVALSIGCLSISTVFAQSLNKEKMDSLLNVLSLNNKVMGTLAVSAQGKSVYNGSMGYLSVSDSKSIPANEKTIYRIGSISKLFTATMVFQLIEEGKLTLSNKLDTWFPEVPNAKLISIEHLLGHRSGIYNFTNDPEYTQWMTIPKTHAEILQKISKNPSVFTPGSKWEYSNSNYVLLSYILEKITGKGYSELLKEKITDIIGLTNTYCGTEINTDRNEAKSYGFMGQWKELPETDMSIPSGAGAVCSTPYDLTKFITALFSNKLIRSESLSQMKSMFEGHGLGLFEYTFSDKKAFGHNGGIDGFISMLRYFPEEGLAVAFCTNGQTYPLDEIYHGILSICFNKEYKIPVFKAHTLHSISTEDLDKYLGVYESSVIPIKITITKNDTILIAQGEGQSAFPLEYTAPDQFQFEAAGIIIEFNPEKEELLLKQSGGIFLFKAVMENPL
ncbi:MAG: serine hydrolase [Bacteroidales bacterium]|nr:serine hydrolase [Bacteroidales bacterium]